VGNIYLGRHNSTITENLHSGLYITCAFLSHSNTGALNTKTSHISWLFGKMAYGKAHSLTSYLLQCPEQ
jgi:hypothetical protein